MKTDDGWDQLKYTGTKEALNRDLDMNRKKPYDLMLEYKRHIIRDEFEEAKAITEVLKPLNYDTKDTHKHIPQLWS